MAVGPAHEVHDDALRDAEDEQHGRRGVAGVVQTCFPGLDIGPSIFSRLSELW
jgi:hypothetical protein